MFVTCTGLPSRNGSFPAKDWTRAHNWLGATRSCEEYYSSTGMSQNHNLSLCIVFVSLCFVSALVRVLFPQDDKFLSALFDSWVVISDPGMELKPGYQLVNLIEKKTWLLYTVICNLMKLNPEKICMGDRMISSAIWINKHK